MAQAIIPYDGLPQPHGARMYSAGDIVAPSNYQQGGYNLTYQAFGMPSRIEAVNYSPRTQSGNYYALPFYPAVSGNAETRAVGFGYVTTKWYAANGTEVANNTNLSAEIGQFQVWGS
jgi:hypothetical protein